MQVFNSLYKSNYGVAVEDKFSREQLADKFVVWRKDRINKESPTEHRVYPSYVEFREEIEFCDISERIFHEVIFGKQKLKFDIDMKESKHPIIDFRHAADEFDSNFAIVSYEKFFGADLTPELADFSLIVNYIVAQIRSEFYYTYEIDLQDIDFVICDSSRVGVKFSAHIIIAGYYVSNNIQAAEFTNRVSKIIGKQYREVLDFGVNRSVQNFRATNCHNGDNRVKQIISGHEFSDSLISYVGDCALLPDIVDSQPKAAAVYCEGDVARAVEMCAGVTEGHTFRGVHNGILVYNRVDATICEICDEIHHNDNSMMITMVPTDRVMRLYMNCRQAVPGPDGKKPSIVVGEFVPNDATLLKDTKSWSDTLIGAAMTAKLPAKNTRAAICAIPDTLTYCEPAIRDFALVPTLIVQAAMKMGKTKKLKDFIAAHFAITPLKTPIIRIISFRKTFSNNIKDKFPGFTLYLDVPGELTQSRLIIQIESLHRLRVRVGDEVPDLLILDECESIFEQFNAGLIKNGDCFAKFAYLLKASKHVVCMDALINDRTHNILQKMRPGVIHYHNNTYQNAVDDVYNIGHDSMAWTEKIFAALTEGHRIAIPMSSLKKASELEQVIREKFAHLRVKMYSSESRASEKTLHLSDVDQYWVQYDVIIYTPTISAGVSFEVAGHFTKIFGYFTDKSCPVETCIQMLGRIRDVKTREYHICLSASGGNYPCEIRDIKQALRDSRNALYDDNAISAAVQPEYMVDGSVTLHKTPFYDVWIENMRMINISRNYFITHFVDVIKSFGATIIKDDCEIDDGDSKTRQEIADLRKAAKIAIDDKLTTRIMTARDISPEELGEIREIIDAQEDLTEQQQNEYDRARMRQDYDFATDITPKFALRYYPQGKRLIYKNIKKIFVYESADTHDYALDRIRREESAIHRHYTETGQDQKDLIKHYMFTRHNIAIDLIKVCGWKSLADLTAIDEVAIAANLRVSDIAIIAERAVSEFGIHAPKVKMHKDNKMSAAFIASVYTKFISRVLGAMYDVKIAETSKGELGESRYVIRGSPMFKYGFNIASHIGAI